MSTFETLAQLAMAFVAFATIVITVRTSTGGKLTSFQLLLTHFYIEVGLIAAGLAALALALLENFGQAPEVWRYSTYACLAVLVLYMPYYLVRRARIKAPTTPVAVFVTVGYGIAMVGLGVTATGAVWQASFGLTVGFLLWMLVSSGLIFVAMLEDFIGTAIENHNGASGETD